jgi:hypothetical protein
MLALVLSTALLAAGSTASAGASAPLGYSEATTQFLERLDEGALRPSRTRRPVTIGIESGAKGFNGLGLNASYNLTPHWSLDAGGGLGNAGARAGLRGRYNFMTSNWTPFASLGVDYLFAADTSFGAYTDPWARMAGKLGDPKTRDARKMLYRVQSAPSATAMLGMSYQGPRGFSFLGGLGWSQLLDRKSNIVATGRLPDDTRKDLESFHGSGPVATLMLGYSF